MKNYPFSNARYALTVCRIEPENNIHVILEAFSREAAFSVVMIGNWNNSSYGKELKSHYQANAHIHLLDPVYELEELNAIRQGCFVYLHGHSCGGTNPSLVEAMYLGLPIIAFDVNFNRETTENQAFYFSNAENLRSLTHSLDEKQLRQSGEIMREIALRRYTWKRISERYAALF